MKVKVLEFRWALGQGINLATFVSHLAKVGPKGEKMNNAQRDIHVLDVPDSAYIGGILLSAAPPTFQVDHLSLSGVPSMKPRNRYC
jgi:hypothetical protein